MSALLWKWEGPALGKPGQGRGIAWGSVCLWGTLAVFTSNRKSELGREAVSA